MKPNLFFRFFVLLACAVSLSACTSLESMQVSRFQDGMIQQYDVPYETAFTLAKYACSVHSFDIESEDFENGVIVAENGISAMSWGERIGIYFDENEAGKTSVSVVTKAIVKTNFFAPEWDTEIHMSIQQRLYQLKEAGNL